MRRSLQSIRTWKVLVQQAQCRSFAVAAEATLGSNAEDTALHQFRKENFVPEKPCLLKSNLSPIVPRLPASSKWFNKDEDEAKAPFASFMNDFAEWPFPFEMMKISPEDQDSISKFQNWLLNSNDMANQVLAGTFQSVMEETSQDHEFFQIYAPLQLLFKAIEYNRAVRSISDPPIKLYIAQSLLADLPPALRDDLPVPEIVRKAGKGDVYGSSVWLGTEPTFTPLHRDPNPNVFCQLYNSKLVRLLPPDVGKAWYTSIQARLQKHGNSHIRSTEMMEGLERLLLREAIWESNLLPEEMREEIVYPGDALFIPKGWWHSVKSKGSSGDLNGSVNWWFR